MIAALVLAVPAAVLFRGEDLGTTVGRAVGVRDFRIT
jgi:hypothetical protein